MDPVNGDHPTAPIPLTPKRIREREAALEERGEAQHAAHEACLDRLIDGLAAPFPALGPAIRAVAEHLI